MAPPRPTRLRRRPHRPPEAERHNRTLGLGDTRLRLYPTSLALHWIRGLLWNESGLYTPLIFTLIWYGRFQTCLAIPGAVHAGVPSLGTRPTTLVYRCAMNKPVSPPCEHFAELSSVRLPSPGGPCMRPVPHRLRLRHADAIIPRRCDAMICGRSLIRYMLRAGTCQLRTQVPAQNFTEVRLRGTKPWSHHRHRLLWSCRPWRRPSRA